MSPTQPNTSIQPSATTTTQQLTPSPNQPKWQTQSTILLALLLTLLLSSTAALYLLRRRTTRLQAIVNGQNRTHNPHHHHHQNTHHNNSPNTHTAPETPNPHPFGTSPWLTHETTHLPRPARDALHIADLEAQNDLLEQRVAVLEEMAGLLERRNGELLGRMGAAGCVAWVPDPEVLRRVREEVGIVVLETGDGVDGDFCSEGEGEAEAEAVKVSSEYTRVSGPSVVAADNNRHTSSSTDASRIIINEHHPRSPPTLILTLNSTSDPSRSRSLSSPPVSPDHYHTPEDSTARQRHISGSIFEDEVAEVYEMIMMQEERGGRGRDLNYTGHA